MLLIVHSTTECLVGWLTCAIRQLTRLVSIWNYIRADLRFCRIKFNFFVCLRFVAPLGCNSAQQMCFLSVCVWLCLFCSRNWHRQKHMVIHIQWVCVCWMWMCDDMCWVCYVCVYGVLWRLCLLLILQTIWIYVDVVRLCGVWESNDGLLFRCPYRLWREMYDIECRLTMPI